MNNQIDFRAFALQLLERRRHFSGGSGLRGSLVLLPEATDRDVVRGASSHAAPRAVRLVDPPVTFELAHLSEPKLSVGAATIGDKAVFAGGLEGLTSLSSVDIYDATSGQWTVGAPLPHSGRDVGTGVGGMALFTGDPDNFSHDIDVYDPLSNTWSSASVPSPGISESPALSRTGDQVLFVGGFNDAPKNVSWVYRIATGAFSRLNLPVPADGGAAVAVADKVYIPPAFTGQTGDPPPLDVFDANTGTISLLSPGVYASSAAAVGTKIFLGGQIFDTVTGTLHTLAVPSSFNFNILLNTQMASIGSKILFPGAVVTRHGRQTEEVAVYDDATNRWSLIGQAAGTKAGITAVGTKLIFAGGELSYLQGTDAVGIYTDLTPTAELAGDILHRTRHSVSVAVFNSGDADLPAGATVAVYASTDRTLSSHPVLLGSIKLASALPAGSSIDVTVTTSTPNLPAGSYHLLAVVATSKRHFTPIAATSDVITVASRAHQGLFAGGSGAF